VGLGDRYVWRIVMNPILYQVRKYKKENFVILTKRFRIPRSFKFKVILSCMYYHI
jgi:hypothetical protein